MRITVLAIGAFLSLCAMAFFLLSAPAYFPKIEKRKEISKEIASLQIPCALDPDKIFLPLPNIEGELAICFEYMRPGSSSLKKDRYGVRIKKNGQVQKIELPARLGLKYENGLQFSNESSLFWADFSSTSGKEILVKASYADKNGEILEAGSFFIRAEETPLKSSLDLQKNGAFQSFVNAKLLGSDLFLEKYQSNGHSQRLSMESSEWFFLKEGDLLGCVDGKWQKISSLGEIGKAPLVRVSFFDDRTLNFDAWDLDEYFRFSVSSTPPLPLKTKIEEFIASVRIRSEKQISCMLDKQCFVLRSGDWVLKEDARWKILRKTQEKEDYLQGKVMGDLFVFDRIESKGAQKMIQGSLFNSGRSQVFSVEVGASGKNSQGNSVHRSKGK